MEEFSPKVARIISKGEPLVGLAALATIPLLLSEESISPGWSLFANSMIWLVFTAHFLIILKACHNKLERRLWWRRSILDVIIIVATFPLLPSTLQSLRLLRAGHTARFFRILRMGRFLTLTWLLRFAKRRYHLSPIVFSGSTAVVAILVGANAIHLLEPEVAPDLGTAVWYAFSTCTTVGYGDVSPSTAGGRFVGVLLMIVGVACMASFSGALASHLMATQEADDRVTVEAVLKELRALRQQLDRVETQLAATTATSPVAVAEADSARGDATQNLGTPGLDAPERPIPPKS